MADEQYSHTTKSIAEIAKRMDAFHESMIEFKKAADDFKTRLDGIDATLARQDDQILNLYRHVEDRFMSMELRFEARFQAIEDRLDRLERMFDEKFDRIYALLDGITKRQEIRRSRTCGPGRTG